MEQLVLKRSLGFSERSVNPQIVEDLKSIEVITRWVPILTVTARIQFRAVPGAVQLSPVGQELP
jgi:hypothetical protein